VAQQPHVAYRNNVLVRLREARGQSQQDIADALSVLAVRKGKNVTVTSNQIGRWERGINRPWPVYRQLLAEYFGVTVDQLGLAHDRQPEPEQSEGADVTMLATVAPPTADIDPEVAASQNEWRRTRRTLNTHRVPLARQVANLYPADLRLDHTGLLINPALLPDRPIPLAEVGIGYNPGGGHPPVTGTNPASANARPLYSGDRRYLRYSQAIRGLDHPSLFENRLSWRLTGAQLDGGNAAFTFGDTSYFEMIDVAEVLAHEAAQHMLDSDGRIRPAPMRALPMRNLIGDDPFNTGRRALGLSTDTLTIRRDRDGASFVLHQRNAGNVAVAGGMLHVMPCGVFQPSSIHPAAQQADLSLWRNIQREYSEEFLGNPEHDGSGQPIDYGTAPFGQMQQAVNDGRLRVYYLGFGLDALTLVGEVLTVAVWDGDLYDDIFAAMVDTNEEGQIVKTGKVHPTSAIPFSEHMIGELVDGDRMAPAGAGCLALAWQHRRTLLDG
jgi:transcriptional regulator with XRE-family HTH domain